MRGQGARYEDVAGLWELVQAFGTRAQCVCVFTERCRPSRLRGAFANHSGWRAIWSAAAAVPETCPAATRTCPPPPMPLLIATSHPTRILHTCDTTDHHTYTYAHTYVCAHLVRVRSQPTQLRTHPIRTFTTAPRSILVQSTRCVSARGKVKLYSMLRSTLHFTTLPSPPQLERGVTFSPHPQNPRHVCVKLRYDRESHTTSKFRSLLKRGVANSEPGESR